MTKVQSDSIGLTLLVVLDLYLVFDLAIDVWRWYRNSKRKASEMLLEIAMDSYVPCPEEACGDCGQETYGEDHACAYLTTLDVACIQRSKRP